MLARVDRGEEHLDRTIVYGRDALLPYAPVTSRHVGDGGMSVEALCEAAVTLSDNTAAQPAAGRFRRTGRADGLAARAPAMP